MRGRNIQWILWITHNSYHLIRNVFLGLALLELDQFENSEQVMQVRT
jgi:hypothetical protein